MLMLHSTAFGLYLVSDVVYYGLFTYHVFHWNSDKAWSMYFAGGICMYVLSFVSQVLLCLIYWDLGNENPLDQDIRDTQSSDRTKPDLEMFDEYAEVQARIWNCFQNERLEAREDGSEVSVNQTIVSFLVISRVRTRTRTL